MLDLGIDSLMRKILFISHESTRTGASFVLLYLLQWLKEHHPIIQLDVLSLQGGGLCEEMRAVSDNYYEFSSMNVEKAGLVKRFFRRLNIASLPRHPKEAFIKEISRKDYDLVYVNTVVSLPLASQIKVLNNKLKIIVHVHELEGEIQRTVKDLQAYADKVNSWIAVSNLVKQNLISRHNISEQKINVIYEFTKILIPPVDKRKISGNFVVGGSGKFGYRKGGDLFLQVAGIVQEYYPLSEVEFIWVGVIPDSEKTNLELELKKLELKNIKFVGEVENPELYFQDFDVFLLTSREDPFPLVCIEAGMLAKPIICFQGATGIAEVIKDKGGFIVPHEGIKIMAEKIMDYKNNPKKLQLNGKYNRLEFSKFTSKQIAPSIFHLLEKL